jgi:hypothetical protein
MDRYSELNDGSLSDEIELTLRNFNIDTLKEMNRENVFGLLVHKWYMYGVYDTIGILGEKYVISKKTKKKIELIKYNAKS